MTMVQWGPICAQMKLSIAIKKTNKKKSQRHLEHTNKNALTSGGVLCAWASCLSTAL